MSNPRKNAGARILIMKALIIYRNYFSAGKANAMLQRPASSSHFVVEWNVRPWRVDMLKFPPLAKEALADALGAHLIVFTDDCAQSFPFWLEDWLEEWAERRQIIEAVLGVMGGGAVPFSATPSLSLFARQHALNVIFDGRVGTNDPPLWVYPPDESGSEISPVALKLTHVRPQDAHRDWGIND
jgi:hypothetical protein